MIEGISLGTQNKHVNKLINKNHGKGNALNRVIADILTEKINTILMSVTNIIRSRLAYVSMKPGNSYPSSV